MNTVSKSQIEQLERMLRLPEAETPHQLPPPEITEHAYNYHESFRSPRRSALERFIPTMRSLTLLTWCVAGFSVVNAALPLLLQPQIVPLPTVNVIGTLYDQQSTDQFLGSKIIGGKIPGLSLNSSLITGHADAQSLTSVTYWNLQFKNTSNEAQEARARIALPEGAAVSRLTLWVDGVAQEAAFNSTERTQAAYNWIVNTQRDPVLVTQTKEGEIFVQAYPVPSKGEMKVRIGFTAPLKVNTPRKFALSVPRLLESNFADSDTTTKLKLESNASVRSTLSDQQLSQEDANHFAATGTLKGEAFKNCVFTIERPTDFTQFASRATHSAEKSFIVETLAKVGKGYTIITQKTQRTPQGPVAYDFATASRMSTVWATQEIRRCLQQNDRKNAALLGYAYRVVSPVTSAVVLETEGDYQYTGLARQLYGVVSAKTRASDHRLAASSNQSNVQRDSKGRIDPHSAFFGPNEDDTFVTESQTVASTRGAAAPMLVGATNGTIGPQGDGAPMLQGATNGTIGPQGADATVITGVNTAGTVRVNNLAYLEAAISWLPVMAALEMLISATILLIVSFKKSGTPSKRMVTLVAGAVCAVACLIVATVGPAMVNFVIACMRDANLIG